MSIYIGNKERIIAILEKFEAGLTYNNLLEQFKKEYGIELTNGYSYLKRLKKKGKIDTFKAHNTKGKIITYKLIPNTKQELGTNNLDTELKDKYVLLMVRAEINSEDYGIKISKNEIEPSIKRLKTQGKI